MKAHILSFSLSRSSSVSTDWQGLASLGLTWAKGLLLHLALGAPCGCPLYAVGHASGVVLIIGGQLKFGPLQWHLYTASGGHTSSTTESSLIYHVNLTVPHVPS